MTLFVAQSVFCVVYCTGMDINHTNTSPCHFTAHLPSPIHVTHLYVRMQRSPPLGEAG